MRYADGLFSRKESPGATALPGHGVAKSPSAPGPPAPSVSRPGSAPAPSGAVPLPVAPRTEEGAGSRLIVGANIKLRGVEIDDCDTLVVEGRVEATMVSRAIQVAEHGSFKGTAEVDAAEIRGVFEGELTVRGRLVVHATGRIVGKIRYGKLLVQEGGEVSGDIGTTGERAGDVAPA